MTYSCQVVIPMDDALPENFATNTFHFEADGSPTQFASIESALNDFYNEAGPFLSSLITPNSWTYKWLDLDDPKPRAPIRTTTPAGPSITGTTALPPEVAICISTRAAPVSGFPRGRQRNRVYIGPLAQNAVASTGRPAPTCITAMVAAGNSLLDDSSAAAWAWVIYSPTQAAAGLTPTDVIAEGWVDDEFDTQRRRGRRPTARTTFT